MWVCRSVPDFLFFENGNSFFSSVSWEKSLKKKSWAREATSEEADKMGKDIPMSRHHTLGSCTQPQAGKLESQLLENSRELRQPVRWEPCLCSRQFPIILPRLLSDKLSEPAPVPCAPSESRCQMLQLPKILSGFHVDCSAYTESRSLD